MKILKIEEDNIKIGYFDKSDVPFITRDVDSQKVILNLSKKSYLQLQDLILQVYYG